jgi:hypothetical protein
MVEINITKDQLDRATDRYEFGSLNGSITKGRSNIYGAIGEIVAIDYLRSIGKDVNDSSTYDYDFSIGDKTIDVKTKRTTVKPKPHYLCSVSNFNTTQECDFYIFVRVKESKDKAYILGFMDKEEFYENAEFKKKGEIDVDGWYFKDDCYNLPIKDLDPM